VRVEELLDRLEGVSGGNGQWHARCPAHEDRQASLTVSIGRDGQILVTCWAGCDLDAIVRAVGCSVRDLFPTQSDRALSAPSARISLAAAALPTEREITHYSERLQRSSDALRMVFDAKGWRAGTCAVLELGLVGERITIPVRDVDGTLRNFLRYSPNGHAKGPKMLAEQGYPRLPLYLLLPDESVPVWIVEGEADAISVANVGLSVIGAPGATAKARPEWLDVVQGRDVIVCMDHDDAGRKAAQRWARVAHEQGAASVRVVAWADDTPDKYDVGELVRELRDEPGRARDRLVAMGLGAPVYVPPERVSANEGDVVDAVVVDDLPEQPETGHALVFHGMASVESEPVRWLWESRVSVGRLGILFGPPGQGKSTLLATIIAAVTSHGGRVLVASAEDDPRTTIRPRLIAAGADLSRVTLVATRATYGETGLLLPRDLLLMREAMRGHSLLLIDPLSAHLADVNVWKDQEVRALVLAPLLKFASDTGCTVLCVMHLNKSQGADALSRISGTGGFGATARFALLLGAHPDDVAKPENERRQVLVHVKASEGPRHPAMVFRREQVIVEDSGHELDTPTLRFVGVEQIAPESVLAVTDPDEAGAFGDAVEWLQRELIDGAKPAKRLLAAARERGDFSERTLRKAKRALRVRSVREPDGWYWQRGTST
jgi:hypothetical protein